jgi:single-strand DNA-binding protein
MSSFNKVSLFGNIGKDAEVKHLDGDKIVAKFSLATSEIHGSGDSKTTETQWHNVVCWGKLAELSEKFIKKGMSIIVDGKIVYRNYENKDGVKVYMTEIIANQMHFTGKKEADSGFTAKDEFSGSANKEAIVNKSKEQTGSKSDINDLPGIDTVEDNLPF